MTTMMRFVDGGGAVRLDLNDPTGFVLLQGWSLGDPDLEQVWLHQAPSSGAVLASSRDGIRTMLVPIRLTQQVSIAAVQTKMTALFTELGRVTNVIEFRPTGAAASYLIDTFRAPAPSLFRGQDTPNPAIYLQDTRPMELLIPRMPEMRGAGVHV